MTKDKVGRKGDRSCEGMLDPLNEEMDLGPSLGPNFVENLVDTLLLCNVNHLVG